MRRRSRLRWVSLALGLLSLVLLGLALWPVAPSTEYIPLAGETLSLAQGFVGAAFPTDYALTLQWPAAMPLGSAATARLSLAPVKGQSPPLGSGFNRVVIAELRASGLVVDPEGEIAEPLLPGSQVSFGWTLRAVSRGAVSATMFLRLQLVPQGGGATVERTIWARPMETRVLSPLGLTQSSEFALGMALLIVGVVLAIPQLLGRFGR
jgi:hypothetical protein